MKKLLLAVIALSTFVFAKAQWVNDPSANTLITNCRYDAGEILVSTDTVSGDTYIQWNENSSNGYAPHIQRLNIAGEPQWGNGLTVSGPAFNDGYSLGRAMVATPDRAVVTSAATRDGRFVALKIKDNAHYVWGEQGITLFDGERGVHAGLMAGENGGVWALGIDYESLHLCYVNPDGTQRPTVTITPPDGKTFGNCELAPAPDGNVFIIYETDKPLGSGGTVVEKEIYIRGYDKDGTAYSEESMLMSTQWVPNGSNMSVTPDGLGGGFIQINYYDEYKNLQAHVFHFDHYGMSTILDLNGVQVHTSDSLHICVGIYGTVDPASHDYIIVSRTTNVIFLNTFDVIMNRVTPKGDVLWGNGIAAIETGTTYCGIAKTDAFESGNGFMVSYHLSNNNVETNVILEAKGFDMDGELLWTTVMNDEYDTKIQSLNSSGYHFGQNIIAWYSENEHRIYAQNIGKDGSMGDIYPHSVPENEYEEIVDIVEIYNINGQALNTNDINKLDKGVYILKGLTNSGKTVVRKVFK